MEVRLLLGVGVWVLLLYLLVGCSALNNAGIGGEPVLMCKYRDGTAYIDDPVVGSDEVHASVARRFADVDALCAKKS